jgi:molybdenum cofactor cytidylyltransferase
VKTPALILAAGSGSRMGRLKQLLPYNGGSLVQNAVAQAREAGFEPVVVVIGAESKLMRTELAPLPAEIVENSDWQLGMGSSIVCGMRLIQRVAPESAAVLILLADQPLVTADHLRNMRALLSHDCSAVAAQYEGSAGVPAIFQRRVFSALLSLAPQTGAKQMLRSLGEAVKLFPVPEAGTDVDTPEDYARLTS